MHRSNQWLSTLANCRYVAHKSDRQGQNSPKGYHAPQERTPEIAHIHVGRPHNGIVWMQSDLRPQSLYTVFSGAYFNQCRAPITPTFGQPWAVNMSTEFDMLKKLKEVNDVIEYLN